MEYTNGNNSIAVIWYDGTQEYKVVNVFPYEYNADTSNTITRDSSSCDIDVRDENIGDAVHDDTHHNEIISRGIDNVAFHPNMVQTDCFIDSIDENTPSCSSSNVTTSYSSSGSGSNYPSVEETISSSTSVNNTSRCSSACSSIQTTSNRNDHFSHDNPAFEMPNELSYDAVVKRGPINPNVYLVRKRSSTSEPITCTCPSNDVLQVRPTELVDDISRTVLTNDNDAIDCKLHVMKRGIVTPTTNSVCNLHPDEIISTNKKQDGDNNEPPPPNYSSLRFMFLEDEPPKYQDVTGKKLAMGDPPKMHHATTSKWKRRLIVFAVIIFIILIGALLVYACFVSGQPLGTYGTVPRKF